jgi:SAM-dependent methyltransferase
MKALKRTVNKLLGRLGYEMRKKPIANDEPANVVWEPIGLEGLIPPRELWVDPSDPLYWFFGYPWEYRVYLTLLCGMQKDASVLELGCNHGRTMLMLLKYLEPPGRYEGLDILPKHIEFAQKHIHAQYPLANFTLADVYNGLYNPQGKHRAAEYRFPYADNWFDIVYAVSVYTHLSPPDAANYLKESRRVLRKGGRCLFSFFILDYYGGPGTPTSPLFEFKYSMDGHDDVALYNKEIPENVIAYKISLIKQMAERAGLRIKQIIPGYWSKTHNVGVNEQDLVLFEAV